jgi:UDP-glucose 4-epimerase
VSVFLHRILTGQPITIWDDGGVVGDYLYVSDLVDALERAPEVEPRERVINIGSGRGVSLNELLQLIALVYLANSQRSSIFLLER